MNLRRVIGWLLLLLSVLLVISGLGITEFRTVGQFTFGLITKPLAFQLHSLLWIPFVAILAGHLALSCGFWRRGKE